MNKEPKKAVIITHSGDPDGIVSAAFIADILELKSVGYELRFADYPNLTEVLIYDDHIVLDRSAVEWVKAKV